MSQEIILTKEIVEQHLKGENPADWNEFTSIEDEAAEMFVDLWEEDDEVEPDTLNGLETLGDAAALSLSRVYLDLRGLTALGDSPGHLALAEKFLENGWVWLDSLTTLGDAAAEILSKCKDELSLSGLKTLSDAAAESFSKCKGALSLSGLKTLSDAAAESLSKHKGEYVYLGGLTELGDSPGHVSLARSLKPGMPEYHPDASLYYEGSDAIFLPRLTTLSDTAAESLPKDFDLDLRSLPSLSDAAAKSLSECHGQLNLNGLTELSDAAAESLSKFEGWLELNGLYSISDSALENLSKLGERVSFDNAIPRLKPILERMKSDGIAKVVGHWNGSDDEGCIDGFLEKETGEIITFGQLSSSETDLEMELYECLARLVPRGSEINHGSVGTLVIDLAAGQLSWSFNWNEDDKSSSRRLLEKIREKGIGQLAAQFRFELKDDLIEMIKRGEHAHSFGRDWLTTAMEGGEMKDIGEYDLRMIPSQLWELGLGEVDGEWQTSKDGREELICDCKSLKCQVLEAKSLPDSSGESSQGMEKILINYLVGLSEKCRSFDESDYASRAHGDNIDEEFVFFTEMGLKRSLPLTVFDKFFAQIYGKEVDLKQISPVDVEKFQGQLVDSPLTLKIDTIQETLTFLRGEEKFVHQVTDLKPDDEKSIRLEVDRIIGEPKEN